MSAAYLRANVAAGLGAPAGVRMPALRQVGAEPCDRIDDHCHASPCSASQRGITIAPIVLHVPA